MLVLIGLKQQINTKCFSDFYHEEFISSRIYYSI